MPKRVWTPERHARLMALVQDGRLTLGLVQAAEQLGCSWTAVADEVRRLGLLARATHGWSPERRWWTPARQQKLRALCRDGKLTQPVRDVARRLGCHSSTVSR